MNQTVFALREAEKSLSALPDKQLQDQLGHLIQQSYQAILRVRAQRLTSPGGFLPGEQQGKLF